jgi:hypothetical protein
MIDITKPVRTKDGQRVEIFSDKGREPYPLIGYIGDSTALGTWTKKGMFFEQESSHHDLENYEPEPQPEEWAAEKAAFAAGKAIQYRSDNAPDWTDSSDPFWFSSSDNNFNPQYRIKPEPQWVPLDKDDIVVGVEFLSPSGDRFQWSQVDERYVWLSGIKTALYLLMDDGYKYRINGGEWRECKKEVQP